MLGLKEAADKLARANGVRWYGHVLRRPEEDVLIKEMNTFLLSPHHQQIVNENPRLSWCLLEITVSDFFS